MLGGLFGKSQPQHRGPLYAERPAGMGPTRGPNNRNQTYSRVFRWRLPDGQTHEPQSVQIVGSFTQWKPVALQRDGALDAWHATVHHIPGGRTHHYMLLLDGQPAYDKTCDGFAVPQGPQEEQYQLETDRGPRVLMLFAQTK